MFRLNKDNRYFLYNHARNIHKGFDSIQEIVSEHSNTPLIKLLLWEREGLTIILQKTGKRKV